MSLDELLILGAGNVCAVAEGYDCRPWRVAVLIAEGTAIQRFLGLGKVCKAVHSSVDHSSARVSEILSPHLQQRMSAWPHRTLSSCGQIVPRCRPCSQD